MAQEMFEHQDRVKALLGTSPQDTRQNGVRVSAGVGSVAAAGFAGHHRGSDFAFGRVIGRCQGS